MELSTIATRNTDSIPVEQTVVELRKDGMTIAEIMKATGLPERKVKDLTKGIAKPPKAKKAVTKTQKPFNKAVERVFSLAITQYGIRDYELRNIMHEEYGSKWDTTTGNYVSNYDQSTIKRVKQKVRLRAAEEDCNVLFVMDWVDEEAPTEGRKFLEAAAADLMFSIKAHTHQYMEIHATRWREDSEEADLAQRKQLYAVERHLLKMAVKGFGIGEPLAALLERSIALTDLLEGTPDAPMPVNEGDWQDEKPEYYPEPKGINPFLDFVESQGWLKEVEDRFA
ncbi:hypothetical protein [Pseudomonas umsongensis]|uniref:hypothetical protein n=1 Tax=Pseudomonas umsongensis TaxID=198618 RepID=UPI00200A3F5C|nr:hypothetical protein [Pseudomonas umsongensis]MCK8654899.1 hypothetical protein [Pseudomonas umsongensis]